jgi:hypothetical protein
MLRELITAAAFAAGLSVAALAPAQAHGGFGGGGGFHGGGGGFRGGGVGFREGGAGFHGGGMSGGLFGGSHPGFRGDFHQRFGGGSRPAFDHFRPRAFADRERFAGRFHHRFFRGAFLAGGDPYDYGYDDNYPYYAQSGYCYLTRHWVWNGRREVHRLVRICE